MYESVIEKIKLEISKAKRIAVMGHINADGDTIGACVATHYLLKNSDILFEEQLPSDFMQLLDFDYKIYDGKMSGYDLVIALDCADQGRLGTREKLLDDADFVINIDHHVTNTNYGDINIVSENASATCELLYQLIDEASVPVTKDAAQALMVGISTDTGHFRFSNTTPTTMEIAGELIKKGIDMRNITKLLYETVDYNVLMFRSYATVATELFYDGRIAVLCVSDDMLNKYGVSYQDADQLSQVPRSIAGVDVGIVLKQKGNIVKASMRADGAVDLSAFAFSFGGGGHKNAAGISFENKTIEEVKDTIINALVSEMK